MRGICVFVLLCCASLAMADWSDPQVSEALLWLQNIAVNTSDTVAITQTAGDAAVFAEQRVAAVQAIQEEIRFLGLVLALTGGCILGALTWHTVREAMRSRSFMG